jgi:hypothetical protein
MKYLLGGILLFTNMNIVAMTLNDFNAINNIQTGATIVINTSLTSNDTLAFLNLTMNKKYSISGLDSTGIKEQNLEEILNIDLIQSDFYLGLYDGFLAGQGKKGYKTSACMFPGWVNTVAGSDFSAEPDSIPIKEKLNQSLYSKGYIRGYKIKANEMNRAYASQGCLAGFAFIPVILSIVTYFIIIQ